MRRTLSFGLILLLAGAASAAFQGNPNFRNVGITYAARDRTDWRTCAVDGMMDWSAAEALGDGVVYLPLKLTTKEGWSRIMFGHVVRVDTSKPNLRFTGNDRCAGWGEPNKELQEDNTAILKQTVREKTCDFIARFRGDKTLGGRSLDMIFAVNGQGWGGSFKGVTYTFESGWAMLNSIQYSEGLQLAKGSYGCATRYCPGVFVVWKDGTIDIVDELAEADIPRVWHAITPHMCRLMTDGEITVKHYVDGEYVDYSDTSVRPRTAYGISSDRRYFYALVLDGDETNEGDWSAGATFLETARVMKAAGCHQALNMDGGGSSNIASWDSAENRPKMLGRPSGGFWVGGQRDGGSQCGVYLAPILATVGDWRYDSADALVQDIADGELPEGIRTADVTGTLVFSSEKPTLTNGTDFTFASTNAATVAWADGEGRVAAETRVGFKGVRFADGSRTVFVAAGGQIVVDGVKDLETVKTADRNGFVLGGALSERLTIDCASAQAAGTVFGSSELSYEETLRQLPNLACRASTDLLACAERVDGRTLLKWGGITFSSNAVKVRKDDRTAVVTVSVAGVSPSITADDLKLALTVTNDDGTSVDTYAQNFTGVGSYSFSPTGAGFGYSYRITLVDGAGAEVPDVGATDGVFTFGTETEWFAADCAAGTVRGGCWTSDEVFTATEGAAAGKVRIVTEVFVDDDSDATSDVAAKTLGRFSEDIPQAALLLLSDGPYGVWQGLMREGDAARWLPLKGGEVELGDPCAYVLIVEIDFSSGAPRVRYFAGPKASGAAALLSDASGRTAFAGAGRTLSVNGVVALERFVGVNSLVGYRRVKVDKGSGTVLYLARVR